MCLQPTDPPEDPPEEGGELDTRVLAPAPCLLPLSPTPLPPGTLPPQPGWVSSLCPPKAPAPPFPTDARGESLGGTQPGGERVLGFPKGRISGNQKRVRAEASLFSKEAKQEKPLRQSGRLSSQEKEEAPAVSRRFAVSMGNC